MNLKTVFISTDAYEDPEFRNAFKRMPNQRSNKVLALLIFKCFHKNCGQNACDGITQPSKNSGRKCKCHLHISESPTYNFRWNMLSSNGDTYYGK